ncbi:hypothetical protein DFH08DRAFT_827324 [Mycena albidolilacea]|uniref:Uncharacterized protein n=1 Tax=Mycena albidolilacea TaxID=1033008 RepID=A0AAD7E7F7_9AGAR|nr:hypothetical protein DFH08DRAFT_827324 [Mycena albidolilacea]
MCRWRHVRNLYLRCGHAENLVSVLLPLFNGTVSKPFSRSRRLRSSAQVLSANLAPTTDLVVFRPLAPRPATNIIFTQSNILQISMDFVQGAAGVATRDQRISSDGSQNL